VASTRRLAAIMFTDMVGYTASTQADESGALELVRDQERLIRPLFSAHQGREIKSTGDGFLVEFDSALQAVRCAIAIQRSLHDRNSQTGAVPIRVRIGIHLGDVEEGGEDILGDAVNIAARVEPLADPGGICISGAVFDQVHNKIPQTLEKLPPTTLKNLRYQIDLYRIALPWWTPAPDLTNPTPSRLAVLPLANISPDAKDEYFADGLTEELIAVLSQISGLRVIARTSVNQYKSTTKPVPQIGRELDVGTILEGSVRKSGNRIRITLQLIDVKSQEHTWSESYDRDLGDIFAIQQDVAERTAATLKIRLVPSEREALRQRPTTNLGAYQLYLQGIRTLRRHREEARLHSAEEAAQLIQCFEEAIRLDPGFSQAYSRLGDFLIGGSGPANPRAEANARARELVEKGLELDPTSSDAHTARGNLAQYADRDWIRAETEFRKAIELNPSDAVAHFSYGMLLWRLQRFEEAVARFGTAIELDPLDYFGRGWLAIIKLRMGDSTEAIALADTELRHMPDNPFPHLLLSAVHFQTGRPDDLRKELDLIGDVMTDPALRWMLFWRAVFRAEIGEAAEAQQLLARMEAMAKRVPVSLADLAGLYLTLGQKEPAIALLQRDFDTGDKLLSESYFWAHFDSVRDDLRFIGLLEKLNLPLTRPWLTPSARLATSSGRSVEAAG
jgi:adenylate cyclase